MHFKCLKNEKIKEYKNEKENYQNQLEKLKYDKTSYEIKKTEFINYKKSAKNELSILIKKEKQEKISGEQKGKIKALKISNKKKLKDISKNNKLYKKELYKFQLLKKSNAQKELKELKKDYALNLKKLNDFYNLNYKNNYDLK